MNDSPAKPSADAPANAAAMTNSAQEPRSRMPPARVGSGNLPMLRRSDYLPALRRSDNLPLRRRKSDLHTDVTD